MWYPLTEPQEGLWYAQAADPGNPILNTGQYLEITGPLDVGAFCAAVKDAISQSDALRLVFRDGPDGPHQSFGDPPEMTLCDLRGSPDAKGMARKMMDEDSAKVVDLKRGPVAAFTLYQINDDCWFWYQRIHHLAIDGYAMVLLTNQVAALYSARVCDTPPPPALAPFAAVLDEDRDFRISPTRAAQREFWHETLANPPEIVSPAAGRPVSAHHFIRYACPVPVGLTAEIRSLSDESGVSWPDTLTALCGAWLRRWAGGETVLGIPAMNRMGRKSARAAAMVMNVLPLRLDHPEEGPVGQYLKSVSDSLRAARRNGRYRSEYLRRELRLIGGTNRLYGPMINVQPFDVAPVIAGVETRLHILGAGAVDDLTLTFRGSADPDLWFEIDANPDLYDAATIKGHAGRILDFLSNACEIGD